MSGETFKAFAAGAETLEFFNQYQNTCQALDPGFNAKQANPFNKRPGDSHFELLYDDHQKDFYCAAQVRWDSHELIVRGGKLSDHATDHPPLLATQLHDVCKTTEMLVGKQEFAAQVCQEDGLRAAKKFASMQEFNERCSALFKNYSKNKDGNRLNVQQPDILLGTRRVNPTLGDGKYSLLFENFGGDFFCRGDIDIPSHTMHISYGSITKPSSAQAADVVEMTDACTMTRELVPRELPSDPNKCQDKTTDERDGEEHLRWVYHGLLVAAGLKSLRPTFRLIDKIASSALLTRIGGLLRPLFRGLFGYFAFDRAAGLFLDKDHPVRRYGKWVAGGVGMVAPSIIARTGLSAGIEAEILPNALRLGSRAWWPLFVVGLTDHFLKAISGDYETDLDRRATDLIWEEKNYTTGWAVVNPFAYLHAPLTLLRLVIPNTINGLAARDDSLSFSGLKEHPIRTRLRKEDQEYAEQAQAYLRTMIPLLLFLADEKGSHEKNSKAIALLQNKITLTSQEQMVFQVISPNPEAMATMFVIAAIQEQAMQSTGIGRPLREDEIEDFFSQSFFGKIDAHKIHEAIVKLAVVQNLALAFLGNRLNDQELKNFLYKVIAQRIQQAAEVSVYIPGPHSIWANDLFNHNGTLKDGINNQGDTVYERLQQLGLAPQDRDGQQHFF